MRIIKSLQLSALTLFLAVSIITVFPVNTFAAGCQPGNPILTIPTWYQFLPCDLVTSKPAFPKKADGSFDPQGILLVVMAIINILMRVAAILAVVFVVIGGIKYTTSQGNPEGVQNAKNTIIYAVTGLLLTILASGIVSFIARSIH